MRILLVKLSSLGDVVHNFPVATDIRRHHPHAEIDWVTEAPYAALVAAHPAIRRALPLHLRGLKKAWFRPEAWSQIFADKALIAANTYDHIIDTQGLVKSAMITRWAHKWPYDNAPNALPKAAFGGIAGFDRASAREPFATRFYDQCFHVDHDQHAVTRNRQLAAQALGYQIDRECDYGLVQAFAAILPSTHAPQSPYVIFLHATSRADKEWSIASWIALGKALNARGMTILLPSGNAAEFLRSKSIAAALGNAVAIPMLPLTETATLLAHAAAIIGVDTGLAHLAVALGRPTIGIFLTTFPARTGLLAGAGGKAVNLGGGSRDAPVTVPVDDVVASLVGTLWEAN